MGLFRRKNKKGDNKAENGSHSTEPTPPAPSGLEPKEIRNWKSTDRQLDRAPAKAKKVTPTNDPANTNSQCLRQGMPRPKWLVRTKFFQDICNTVFDRIDADGSGEVDEAELYSGLLLIHLKLGTHLGPAACRPLSRERCHAMFVTFDLDNSGQLDRDEFVHLVGVLFGNILSRVMLQYIMTLLFVPLFASTIVHGVSTSASATGNLLALLGHQLWIVSVVQQCMGWIGDGMCHFYRAITPTLIQRVGNLFSWMIAKVPDSLWMSLPLTLTSAIVGLTIVPRCMGVMDDCFQWFADRKVKQL